MFVTKEVVPALLDQLTDDELKKEAKNDAISAILKACKCLVSKIPHQEDTLKDLEIFRLKMILRYFSAALEHCQGCSSLFILQTFANFFIQRQNECPQ
jgi:hypothetical protein